MCGISKYRAELMALAMFAILLTHFTVPFPSLAVERFRVLCQGGVDMFLFLSGFGLYYSGMKNTSPLNFYAKRAKRIFPTFWVILFLTLLNAHRLHWPHFLWGATTLPFWIPSMTKYIFAWFVSLIVALYAAFPFYFRLFKKRPKLATALGVGLGLVLTGLYVYHVQVVSPGSKNRYILPAARLPIFFIGVYAGRWLSPAHLSTVKNKRRIKVALVCLSAISITAFFLLLNAWGFNRMRNSSLLYLLFVPVLPGVLTVMVKAFRCAERWAFGRKTLSLLRLLSQGTLEAYLLIGLTYGYLNKVCTWLHVTPLQANVLLMFATIALALLIHFGVSRFVDWTSVFLQKTKAKAKQKNHTSLKV